MVLADTSIWINHFRSANRTLQALLRRRAIAAHPFLVAELALGSLRDRGETLRFLDFLPQVRVATSNEVRHMIEMRALYSKGIGLIDAHLLASALFHPPMLLWTADRRLGQVAEALGLHAKFPLVM